MAIRPKAVIKSSNGEGLSPITIAKNVLTDDGQNLHDILSDRKEEDMMTPTIENSSSMFKVGQGDDVDYSENVANGSYETCILKGRSLVNYIQEPSKESKELPYDYPVIIKPSTKYSIVANITGSGQVTYNLGGATMLSTSKVTTITTPAILTSETLSCVGEGAILSHVMVIEGDVVGDEPYFEGICDCKSPILTNLDANNEQSNTTTFNQKGGKTIVLRSLPNGVCDTLNVETGEYVQRIGEITFDGSSDENWQMLTAANIWTNGMKNILTFICPKPSNCALTWGKEENEFAYLSNKFPSVQSVDKYAKEDKEKLMFDQKDIKMATLKSKLNTQDLAGFKTWLQSNPVAVQYELAAPIVIKTVDLNGFPFSYENGHVILSSGSIEQSLTPAVEYSVVINRNGQIRSNQKMVERHRKQLDRLQAMILTNLINTQYEQTLTNLKYDLKNVREEVK